MFSAIAGCGAKCNGKPIKTSKNATGTLMTTKFVSNGSFQKTPTLAPWVGRNDTIIKSSCKETNPCKKFEFNPSAWDVQLHFPRNRSLSAGEVLFVSGMNQVKHLPLASKIINQFVYRVKSHRLWVLNFRNQSSIIDNRNRSKQRTR